MILDQFVSFENFGLLAEFSLGLLVMQILLFLTSLFLMLLILVQRGKGGGLTGALGGSGGQSAFGSKAGDAFTKITIVTAVIWIMLCMVTIAGFNPPPAPKATVNNDAEISDSMGGDESDVPLLDQDDGAITGDGSFTEGAAPEGETTEDGNDVGESSDGTTTEDGDAASDAQPPTTTPDSTDTSDPAETKPDGEGN